MNPSVFRQNMEAFAREMNIPLRDVLRDADAVGLESQRVAFELGEPAREQFLEQQFIVFVKNFGPALPPGTKPLVIEDSDE